MEVEAAKAIGAGIACLGMGGAGIGLGHIFGNYLAGALRNPSAAAGQVGRRIFGFAVTAAEARPVALSRSVVCAFACMPLMKRAARSPAKIADTRT